MASETSSVSSLSTQGEGRLPGGRLPKPPPTIALPFKRWIPEYHLSHAQEYHAEAISDVKLIGTKYQEWAKKAVYADLVDVTGRVGGELQRMYDKPKWTWQETRVVKHRARDNQVAAKRSSQLADQEYLYILVPSPSEPEVTAEMDVQPGTPSVHRSASSAGVPLPAEAIEPIRTQPPTSTAPVPDDEVLDSVSDFLSDLRSDADSTTTTPDLQDMMHTATPVVMPNV